MTKTPIEPGDIRKGDLIRKEYRVPLGAKTAFEYLAGSNGDSYASDRGIYFLLDRSKPPVVLPTEPGVYVSYLETPLGTTFHNLNDGRWSYIDGNGWLADSEVAEYLPLTKLEPVPETARRVLNAVTQAMRPTGFMGISGVKREFDAIAKEFGVTS